MRIVPETNTSRPGKKCFCSFASALSHLLQSGRKRGGTDSGAVLSGSLDTLPPSPLGEKDGGALLFGGPPPPRRTSNGPVRFPQTSFRGGNWPWLPRAETESSALKQFLCLVTMRRGISTNPLRCQGFRSSTWEKRAWDLPPPPPCVIPWLLDDGAWRPSISLPYFSSWR